MPRRPSGPNYYHSRHAYYTQVNRQPIRLAGPVCEGCEALEAKGKEPRCVECKDIKKEAWRKYHARMNVAATDTAGDDNSVNAVLEARLQWSQANQAPSTHRIAGIVLSSFARRHGRLRVRQLKKFHVEQWLAEMQQERRRPKDGRVCRWSGTTRRLAATVLASAFNWAAEQGVITKNPLARIKKPPLVSRGAQAVISDRQHQILLGLASRRRQQGFYNLLVALYETGARPGELCGLEARHYNPQMRAWVIEGGEEELARGQNKLAAHGKKRVIYVSERLQPLVERLNQEHPTGPIFPTEDGTFYGEKLFASRLQTYRRRANRLAAERGEEEPFGSQIVPYSYRHRFATEWLLEGKPVGLLADLLGTSIQMIQQHYSHVREYSDRLRDALDSFRTSPAGGATPSTGGPASDVAAG